MAGGGRRVVPGFLLDEAEVVERVGLAEPVTDVAELLERLLVAGGGGRVIPGQALHGAQMAEGIGLAEPVANIPVERQGLPQAFGGGGVVPGLYLDGAQIDEGTAWPALSPTSRRPGPAADFRRRRRIAGLR